MQKTIETVASSIVVMAIVGPEFVLGIAAGQYENAHQSVALFKDLGLDWSIQHAFFVEMGGFMLHPAVSQPFPVNNKHIIWLIQNKYMDFPRVSTRDIWCSRKGGIGRGTCLGKQLTCILSAQQDLFLLPAMPS